jgi:phage shock protein A
MALMPSKTYDALIAAGAPEDKARDAAEEIAAYENRLTRIETDIALIKAELTSFRNELRQTMATKTWVLTGMLAQTFAILGGVAGLLKLLH